MTTNERTLAVAPVGTATNRRFLLGWLLALTATVGFSLSTPLSRNAILLGTNPSTMLICRLALASLLMGSAQWLYKPASLNLGRRGLSITMLLGLLSSISMLCFNWSLVRLPASMAIMIFAINPVVALCFLWLGGEKLTQRQLVRLVLALGGVYLLVGPSGDVDLWGALLVLIALTCWSAQMVGVQWYLGDKDAGTISFVIAATSMVVISGWWWLSDEKWYIPGWQVWASIAVLAILCTFIARLFFFSAIQRIGSGQVALLMPLETMLTIIWSLLFLGESLNLWQWLGASLILTSTVLAVERLGRVRVPSRWRGWFLMK